MRHSYYIFIFLFGITCSSSKTIEETKSCFCPNNDISFNVNKNQNVVILLLDESEVEIDTLFSGKFTSGLNKISPDLSHFESGRYFYKFIGRDSIYTKKFTLIH